MFECTQIKYCPLPNSNIFHGKVEYTHSDLNGKKIVSGNPLSQNVSEIVLFSLAAVDQFITYVAVFTNHCFLKIFL